MNINSSVNISISKSFEVKKMIKTYILSLNYKDKNTAKIQWQINNYKKIHCYCFYCDILRVLLVLFLN